LQQKGKVFIRRRREIVDRKKKKERRSLSLGVGRGREAASRFREKKHRRLLSSRGGGGEKDHSPRMPEKGKISSEEKFDLSCRLRRERERKRYLAPVWTKLGKGGGWNRIQILLPRGERAVSTALRRGGKLYWFQWVKKGGKERTRGCAGDRTPRQYRKRKKR